MMKRVICLLLVALLVCGGAAAEEAYQYELTWESDEAGLVRYIEQTTGESGAQAKNFATGIAELLDNLKISMNIQEGGAHFSFSLKDEVLVDLTSISDWTEAKVLSNLWPGYYLYAEVAQEEAADSQAAYEQLMAVDWQGLGEEFQSACDAWSQSLPKTTEAGHFMGDAYESGLYRETYTFDDTHVVQLMDSLVAVLDAHGINDALLEAFVGEGSVFSSLMQRSSEVGEENRYSYVLHDVYGADDIYMGSSLVVLENGEQVMTLSYGEASNGFRVVWGYGLNGTNYYIKADWLDSESGEGKEFNLIVFEDAARAGYRATEQVPEDVRLMFFGTAKQSEGGLCVDMEVADTSAMLLTRYVLEETMQPEGEMQASLTIYTTTAEGDYVPMGKLLLTSAACEPVTWQTEGLTPIPADAEGDQLLNEVLEESMQDMTVTVFKLIPSQLLTMFLTI